MVVGGSNQHYSCQAGNRDIRHSETTEQYHLMAVGENTVLDAYAGLKDCRSTSDIDADRVDTGKTPHDRSVSTALVGRQRSNMAKGLESCNYVERLTDTTSDGSGDSQCSYREDPQRAKDHDFCSRPNCSTGGAAGVFVAEKCCVNDSATLEEMRRRVSILSKEQLLEIVAFAMVQSRKVYIAANAVLQSDPAARRLMVRGLWFSTTDATFRNYFATFGVVVNAAVIRHPDGRSQGYGFIIYETREAAETVVGMKHVLDGRSLIAKLAADQYTEFSRDKSGESVSAPRRKLFIRNICSGMTEETLYEDFSVYGRLEECAIIRSGGGASRGYGFVTFEKAEDALRAAQMPFRIINGWVIFVTYSTGRPRRKPLSPGGRHGISQEVDALQQCSELTGAVTYDERGVCHASRLLKCTQEATNVGTPQIGAVTGEGRMFDGQRCRGQTLEASSSNEIGSIEDMDPLGDEMRAGERQANSIGEWSGEAPSRRLSTMTCSGDHAGAALYEILSPLEWTNSASFWPPPAISTEEFPKATQRLGSAFCEGSPNGSGNYDTSELLMSWFSDTDCGTWKDFASGDGAYDALNLEKRRTVLGIHTPLWGQGGHKSTAIDCLDAAPGATNRRNTATGVPRWDVFTKNQDQQSRF